MLGRVFQFSENLSPFLFWPRCLNKAVQPLQERSIRRLKAHQEQQQRRVAV